MYSVEYLAAMWARHLVDQKVVSLVEQMVVNLASHLAEWLAA